MGISIDCPACGNRLIAGEDRAGKRVQCNCGKILTVPHANETTPFKLWLTFSLSVAALLMAATSLIMALVHCFAKGDFDQMMRDAGNQRLAKYDFSSPKQTILSHRKVETDFDLLARFELERRYGRDRKEQANEFARTLEIRKETDWQNKKVVFYSYEQKGVKQYFADGFEKDSHSGFWLARYVSEFDVEKENNQLASYMRSWRAKGEFIDSFK